MKILKSLVGYLFLLLLITPIHAQNNDNSPKTESIKNEIKNIKQELDQTKHFYQDQINQLNQEIKDLKKIQEKQTQEEELKKLMEDAQKLSEKKKDKKITLGRVFRGGERQQSQLNPEISMTGDFFGNYNLTKNERDNQFSLREAEFHIIAPLDPFTRGKFFLGVPGDGQLEVGEAYMEWLNLPLNINLKIGQFHNQFGILNRWHEHGLPQFDRPGVLTGLFGDDALVGAGVSANILLPGLWAHVNELDIELTSGGDGTSFDDAYDNVILVSHFKNYFDLNRNTYLEIGFSGAHGFNDLNNHYKTTLSALDLTCKWVPAGRSHYRTIEFRNEFFISHRQTASGYLNRWGFYSYISNKMGAKYWLTCRIGYSELPTEPSRHDQWDISPCIDFWQSEFVMLRIQYSYKHYNFKDNDHAFYIQTVWAMGPHKHEAY